MKKLFVITAIAVTALSSTAFAHHSRHHVNYSVCNYEDCNIDYVHSHDDGLCYYGQYYGDGHSYHDSGCGNQGCHHHCY